MPSDEVYVNTMIRAAMLDKQSEWLHEASVQRQAGNITGISIARVIAEAFENAATEYKDKIKTQDGDEGDAPHFFGDATATISDTAHGIPA